MTRNVALAASALVLAVTMAHGAPVGALMLAAATPPSTVDNTSITVSVQTSPVAVGTPVTVTATVTDTSHSGTTVTGGEVTFVNANTSATVGSASLVNGSASTTLNLAAGSYSIKASYGGIPAFNSSTSASNAALVVVTAMPPTLSPTLSTLTGTTTLSNPQGMAWDGKGNLYIVDASHNQIVVWRGGVLSNFTMSTSTSEVEDVVPSASGINGPSDVKIDAAGNIYICDQGAKTIRVVNMQSTVQSFFGVSVNSGHIQTVIGGSGNPTSGLLASPNSIVFDTAGNLYIGDSAAVYEAVPAGNCSGGSCATRVAGTGNGGNTGDGAAATSAEIGVPTGLAFDANGILYISDGLNNNVRAVNLTASIATLFASASGTAKTPSSPGGTPGPIKIAAGAIQTVANGMGNQLKQVLFDPNGNLYIAAASNSLIYMVEPVAGAMTTFAGNGTTGTSTGAQSPTTASVSNPYGLVLDSFGNFYIATQAPSSIEVIAKLPFLGNAGTVGNTYTGYAFVQIPSANAMNLGTPSIVGSSDITITSTAGCSYGGGTVISAGTVCPIALQFQPTVPGFRNAAISFSSTSCDNSLSNCTWTVPVGGFAYGPQIAVLPGNISVFAGTDSDTGSSPTTTGIPATSASLSPYAIALDPVGNTYMVDGSTGVVNVVSADGTTIKLYAGTVNVGNYTGDSGPATSATLSFPSAVATDAAGNVYIADSGNYAVRKVDRNGIITTVAGGALANLSNILPYAIASDPAGNLYVGGNNSASGIPGGYVFRVDAVTGAVTIMAGNGNTGSSGDGGLATAATFTNTRGLALDGYGNLYLSDLESGECAVRKISLLNGIITTVAGNGSCTPSGEGGPATSASLGYPHGIAVDAAGDLYIAEPASNAVRQVTASTGIINTIVGTFGDWASVRTSGIPGAANAAVIGYPQAVAMDPSGNLYVSDNYHSALFEVTAAAFGLNFPSTNVTTISSPLTAMPFNIGNSSFTLPTLLVGDTAYAQVSPSSEPAPTPDCSFAVAAHTMRIHPLFQTAQAITVPPVTALAPGAGCNLTMTFTPSNTGADNTTATAGSSISVPLTGTGAATSLGTTTTFTVSPSSTTYGTGASFTVSVTSNNSAVTSGTVTFVDTSNSNAVLASNVALNGSGNASFTTPTTLTAGSHVIQATYNASGSYTTSSNTASITVNQKMLTLTASSITSKTYGTTSSIAYGPLYGTGTTLNFGDVTLTVAGFANSESLTSSGFGLQVTDSSGNRVLSSSGFAATATVAGGPYNITVNAANLAANNYTFCQTPQGTTAQTVAVVKAMLTVTATGTSYTYGAVPVAAAASISGFVNNDNNGTNNTLAVTPATSISLSGGVVTGQVLLTITNTSTSATVSAFAANTTAGTYTVAPSSATSTNALTAANYTFCYSNVTVTVAKAGLTITANPQSFAYGGTAPAFGASAFNVSAVTITGFQNNETQATAVPCTQGASPSCAPAFTIQNSVPSTVSITSASPAGTYTIIPSIGSLAAANYTFTTCNRSSSPEMRPEDTCVNRVPDLTIRPLGNASIATSATYVNGTLTINKAPLTVTANSYTVNYGASIPTLGYGFSGFQNTDTSSVVSGTPSLSTTATGGGNAGTYTVTIAQGSLAAANYTFAMVNGQVVINKMITTLSIIGITPNFSGPLGTNFVVTFQVQTAPGGSPPTGTIMYSLDGGTPQTPALSANGTVVVTFSGLAIGKHTITNSYPGDTNYLPATQTPFTLTEGQITPALNATLSSGVITFALTPSTPTPTGTVSCSVDGGFANKVTLSAGTGAFTVPSLSIGSHAVVCSYSGDTNYTAAGPVTTTITVGKLNSQVTAATSFSGTSVPAGQAFNVNVNVPTLAAGFNTIVPTGTITYTVDVGAAQTATLISGSVTLQIAGLTAGSHTIVIGYSGDSNYSSTQTTLTITATGTTPLIPTGGIINGALTTSSLSPGGLASIFGGNLATTTTQATGLPLPTTLGGTTVTINGTASPLLYVSPTQINFQVPYGIALGTASVVISTSAGTGAPFSVTVTAAAPAVFTYVNSSGGTDPVILHGATSLPVSASSPAQAGETLVVYATGAGPVNNPPASGAGAGAGATSITNPSVTVGSASATVVFSGLSQGSVGLFQINITLPATLPAGSGTPLTLPLVIAAPGGPPSPAVNLYVSH